MNSLKVFIRKNNKIFQVLRRTFLTILGTFLLAFGTGVFLVPFGIVSGGITGLGIILNRATNIPVDVWNYIFMWGLFVIGIFFLGFRFSANTLLSTIFYPLFITLMMRTSFMSGLIEMLINNDTMNIIVVNGNLVINGLSKCEPGRLLIMALLGGAIGGIGCGITFQGGGSTGGIDVLSFILKKFFDLKTSISSFIIDGMIVVAGLMLTYFQGKDYAYQFLSGLVGILAAFVCSFMIEIFYSGRRGDYAIDVVTSKPKELNDYVIKNLDRTTTVFKVNGGYGNQEHSLIRICFDRREYMRIKDTIASIDPAAFIISFQCLEIKGSGFDKLESSKENAVSNISKKINSKKKDASKKKIEEKKPNNINNKEK